MRKVFVAGAVLSLIVISFPALASISTRVDDTNFTGGSGGHGTRVDCVGTVVWNTGMYDDFTPPAGCSSAGSSGCFINAVNDQGIEADWRQLAAQFIGAGGDPITNVKIWGRYNQQGYDWLQANPGALHGFCLRIYDDPSQGALCPDGTIPDALGTAVYDVYVDAAHFVAEQVPTGIARCYTYCMTLPTPFSTVQDHYYWVAISADFDNTNYNAGWTQWFWRMAPPASAILCEPVANYSSAGDHQNWNAIWQALGIACWQGWDLSLLLYTNPVTPQTGACCYADGHCTLTTQADCVATNGTYQGDGTLCDPNPCPQPLTGACCVGLDCSIQTQAACQTAGGQYMGDGTTCDPNPCNNTPAQPSTWGKIKQGYR